MKRASGGFSVGMYAGRKIFGKIARRREHGENPPGRRAWAGGPSWKNTSRGEDMAHQKGAQGEQPQDTGR